MKKVLLLVILVGAVGIWGESYYFNGEYVGKYIGLGDESQREYSSLEDATNIANAGDIDGANKIYTELITKTEDPIVLERSIREYGRNLNRDDARLALDQTIALATDSRIRASARAGAMEQLAMQYVSGELPAKYLDETIFANATFAALKKRNGDVLPSHILLLEYANNISVRPLATAVLAEYYAQNLSKENTPRTQKAVRGLMDTLETLIPDIPDTSPNKPLVLTYEASALLLASSQGLYFKDILAPLVFAESIKVSTNILQTMTQVSNDNPDLGWTDQQLQATNFAPDAQFLHIFTTLNAIPKISVAESIFGEYKRYLQKNTKSSEATRSVLEKLSKKYDSMEGLLDVE